MSREHADLWDGSEYPYVHGDTDEPDIWEREGSTKKKKVPKPKFEPDTRADFHGDPEPDIWEGEGCQPQVFNV